MDLNSGSVIDRYRDKRLGDLCHLQSPVEEHLRNRRCLFCNAQVTEGVSSGHGLLLGMQEHYIMMLISSLLQRLLLL